jgi:hypothetical protein
VLLVLVLLLLFALLSWSCELTRYVAMDEDAAAAELGVDFERDLVTAEMKVGDVLLFNNLIPHR